MPWGGAERAEPCAPMWGCCVLLPCWPLCWPEPWQQQQWQQQQQQQPHRPRTCEAAVQTDPECDKGFLEATVEKNLPSSRQNAAEEPERDREFVMAAVKKHSSSRQNAAGKPERDKELEGVKNPIMMKVYQEAGPEEKREKPPAEIATGFWDPMGLTTDRDDTAFKSTRSVEIKHGRVSMAACFGYIAPEYLKWPEEISSSIGLKFADVDWVQTVFCAGISEGNSSAGECKTENPSGHSGKVLTSTDPDEKGKNFRAEDKAFNVFTKAGKANPIARAAPVSLASGSAKRELKDFCLMTISILSDGTFKGGDKRKIEKAVQNARGWLDKNPLAEKEDVEARQKELEGILIPILRKTGI